MWWVILECPTCGPDLEPGYYHLFPAVENHLSKFQSYDDMKTGVAWWAAIAGHTLLSTGNEKSLFHDMTYVSILLGTTIKINMAVIEWHVYCFLDLEINSSEYITQTYFWTVPLEKLVFLLLTSVVDNSANDDDNTADMD